MDFIHLKAKLPGCFCLVTRCLFSLTTRHLVLPYELQTRPRKGNWLKQCLNYQEESKYIEHKILNLLSQVFFTLRPYKSL